MTAKAKTAPRTRYAELKAAMKAGGMPAGEVAEGAARALQREDRQARSSGAPSGPPDWAAIHAGHLAKCRPVLKRDAVEAAAFFMTTSLVMQSTGLNLYPAAAVLTKAGIGLPSGAAGPWGSLHNGDVSAPGDATSLAACCRVGA